ncbi:MAG: polysaccharide biosynthesis tyrosine autokinase [Thiotrichaceae bacterium]
MNKNYPNEIIIQSQDSSLSNENQAKIIAFPSNYGEPHLHEDRASFSDFLKVLSQHKRLIFLTTLATLALSFLIASLIDPVYRSTTTLKINASPIRVLNYDVEVGERIQPNQDFYQGEFKLLQSRVIINKTIDELALEHTLRNLVEKETLIDKAKNLLRTWTPANWGVFAEDIKKKSKPIELELQEKIVTIPSKDWGLVDLTVDWETADGSAAIANSLAQNFIKLSLERRLNLAEDTRVSLNKQILLTKKKLLDSELILNKYAKKQNIVHIDGDKSLTSSKLEALSDAYTKAQQELILAESAFKQQFESAGHMRTLDNKVIESLKVKLGNLQTKYQDQLQIYKANYPSMLQLRQQITNTKSQLDKEIVGIKKGVNNDLKNKYIAAKQNEQKIKQQMERGKQHLVAFQDKNVGYNNLLREVETNKKIYEGLLQRVKEVAVAEDIGTSHISIVEPAYPAYKKHKPNVPVILGLGLLAGLLIGSSLAFQLNASDTRIHSIDDLDNISDIPVLGVFPFVKKQHKALLQNSDHEPSVSEAFRSLRTKLNFSRKTGIPKVIHITSSEPNEGKTSTAINLATVIEESGKSVLLVDADLRIPSVHHYLNKENLTGLSELLTGNAEISNIIQRIDDSNFYILPAGLNDEKSADLLSSDRMLKFLDWAAMKFDHVIIDSPPVLGFADALILSNRAKCTLFVVSSDKIDKKFILDTLKNLELSYANVIGFILTKATNKAQGYYGYDQYYDYSSTKKLAAG